MTNQPIIEITNVSVQYGNIRALDDLGLVVQSGEIFGLLGPNGAGKTTTLACIEGLRRPDSGSVHVAGLDVVHHSVAVKRFLGVQLQRSALFDELNALELVAFYAALYDVYPTKAQCLALLERFGLAQKAHVRPGHLSGGQQQRLTLALALVNDPQVVLLDEPTTGLDPQARRGVWALIKRLRGEGRTILLTTHYMEEAQELCDRVGIVEAGKLIALDTPQALIERYALRRVPSEAMRRQPNLEDVFLSLTGRGLADDDLQRSLHQDTPWLANVS